MGHEVHVASRGGGPNLDRMLAAGVVWHRLSNSRKKNPRVLFGVFRFVRAFVIFVKLLRLIRKLQPDIVQTVLAPMDMLGGAAALLTRSPWVMRECSSAVLYTARRRYSIRFAFGRLADAVVSNSKHGSDYWRPARRGRALYVIPSAVTDTATSNSGKAVALADRPDENVVLYAGRIDLSKNVEGLIAALARIAGEVRFIAIVCGEGSHSRRAQRLASKLGIADRVVFAGYVDNLAALMKRADAFVTLSRCEGCPNVVLEAMACGTPLVVSEIPAHREILDDSMALLVKLDEPIEIAEAIKIALTDKAAARGRATAASTKAAERPTLEVAAQLYESAYLDVIDSRKSSQPEQKSWIERPRLSESSRSSSKLA